METSTLSKKELIAQVHADFYGASDALIEEANKIIFKDKRLEEKIKRLNAIGASSCLEVSENFEKEKNEKNASEFRKYAESYQKKYPFWKYIDQKSVTALCRKYNLVCGDISSFKGFIPEKNLSEIEKVKVKPEDEVYEIGGFFSGSRYVTLDEYRSHRRSFHDYSSLALVMERISSSVGLDDQLEKPAPLMICAPQKDMELSFRGQINPDTLMVESIPDPIVLKRVVGGFLIVTAWGDEASDPIVTNPINN